MAKIFAGRGCRRGAYSLWGRRRAPRKKNAFSRGILRSRDPDIFLRKKMVGKSFQVILMKLHARTGPVAVADLEKMLAKVVWLLEDVSLYQLRVRGSSAVGQYGIYA